MTEDAKFSAALGARADRRGWHPPDLDHHWWLRRPECRAPHPMGAVIAALALYEKGGVGRITLRRSSPEMWTMSGGPCSTGLSNDRAAWLIEVWPRELLLEAKPADEFYAWRLHSLAA